MRATIRGGGLAALAAALLALPCTAQGSGPGGRPPADELGPAGGAAAPEALGSLVAGPFDVETGPFDNRCLGVEEAWGHYWVTGAGHTTTGWNHMIHKYDPNGIYLASFPQVTASAAWGGRDMEADEGANLLWAGSDNGEVSEYAHSGGNLSWVMLHNVPVPGTVRALCMDPSTGHYYTKSFTSTLYEFDLAGNLYNSVSSSIPSAYGFGWDSVSWTIWSTDNGPSVTEITTQSIPTGQAFGPTFGAAQGGADVYEDHRNPGFLSVVVLGQGSPDSIEVYDTGVIYRAGCDPPTFYCRYKDPSGSTACGGDQCPSSGGCKATVYTSPIAFQPAFGADDYDVGVTGAENDKPGLIFYGYGSNSLPFSSGTLCVQPPIKRTPPQNTSNQAGDSCSGLMVIRINNPGEPAGTSVNYQGWMRDPMSPSGTDLSDAVEVTYAPPEEHLGECTGSNPWSVTTSSPNQNIVPFADADQAYQVENLGAGTVRVTRNGRRVKTLTSGQSMRLTADGGDSIAVTLIGGAEANGYWMRDPD